jgi:hypothetical protein
MKYAIQCSWTSTGRSSTPAFLEPGKTSRQGGHAVLGSLDEITGRPCALLLWLEGLIFSSAAVHCRKPRNVDDRSCPDDENAEVDTLCSTASASGTKYNLGSVNIGNFLRRCEPLPPPVDGVVAMERMRSLRPQAFIHIVFSKADVLPTDRLAAVTEECERRHRDLSRRADTCVFDHVPPAHDKGEREAY